MEKTGWWYSEVQEGVFQQTPGVLQVAGRRSEGQEPCLLLASDSRIDPNVLTQTEPGEIFIQRTARQHCSAIRFCSWR